MRTLGRSSSPIALALVAVLALGACTSGEIGAIQDPTGDGGSLNPGDDDLHPGRDGGTSAQKPLVYSGRYELTSIVDLAGAGIFGETISGTLVQLSLFHEHPAATILNLMALYEVPY